MTRIIQATVALLCVATCGQGLFAQQFYAERTSNNGTPVIYRHASTAEQGLLDGVANGVRAVGDYNYNTSLALINYEIARSMFLDNKVKAVQTYFEMRRQNREAREYETGPRPTQQDAERFAEDRAPDRLAAYQYDHAFKKVYWPTLFFAPAYDTDRTAIEKLMRDRGPENSGLGSENHRQIHSHVESMKELLATQVEVTPPAAYTLAKKFLTGLEYEAQQQARATDVAGE